MHANEPRAEPGGLQLAGVVVVNDDVRRCAAHILGDEPHAHALGKFDQLQFHAISKLNGRPAGALIVGNLGADQ